MANWLYFILTIILGFSLWVSIDVIDNAIIMMNLIYFTYTDKFPGEVQWVMILFNVFFAAKMYWRATTQNAS